MGFFIVVHSSLIVTCGFSHCPGACGIFLDQGSNSLPLHCKADFFFFLPSREKRFLFDKLFSEVQHVVRFSLPSWGCVRLRVPYQTGGRQPCPPTSSRTMHRAFGRRRFGLAPISGLLLRQKSEFLSTEWKNGIHKHADTHGGKWTGFIKEEESMKLPAQTRRGGRVPCKADS